MIQIILTVLQTWQYIQNSYLESNAQSMPLDLLATCSLWVFLQYLLGHAPLNSREMHLCQFCLYFVKVVLLFLGETSGIVCPQLHGCTIIFVHAPLQPCHTSVTSFPSLLDYRSGRKASEQYDWQQDHIKQGLVREVI